MAVTVLNGSIDAGDTFTHTNSSGKNERIIINWLQLASSGGSISVYVGTKTNITGGFAGDAETWVAELQTGQTFGKHKRYDINSGVAHNTTRYVSAIQYSFPDEFYLPDGNYFKIVIPNDNPERTMYNFLVVTED